MVTIYLVTAQYCDYDSASFIVLKAWMDKDKADKHVLLLCEKKEALNKISTTINDFIRQWFKDNPVPKFQMIPGVLKPLKIKNKKNQASYDELLATYRKEQSKIDARNQEISAKHQADLNAYSLVRAKALEEFCLNKNISSELFNEYNTGYVSNIEDEYIIEEIELE